MFKSKEKTESDKMKKDIHKAILFFKSIKNDAELQLSQDEDYVLQVLNAHKEKRGRQRKEFIELLGSTNKFLTPRLKESFKRYAELSSLLYQAVCSDQNAPISVSSEMFEVLRAVTKQWLLPKNFSLTQLNELRSQINRMIETLETRLNTYERDFIKKDADGTMSTKIASSKYLFRFGREDQGILILKELREAIAKKDVAFVEILKLIRDRKEAIAADDKMHFGDGLGTYTGEFLNNAQAAIKTHFNGQYLSCLENVSELKAALLDDLFYSLLIKAHFLGIIKKFPLAFLEIMTQYRPDEYRKFMQDEDIKKEIMTSPAKSEIEKFLSTNGHSISEYRDLERVGDNILTISSSSKTNKGRVVSDNNNSLRNLEEKCKQLLDEISAAFLAVHHGQLQQLFSGLQEHDQNTDTAMPNSQFKTLIEKFIKENDKVVEFDAALEAALELEESKSGGFIFSHDSVHDTLLLLVDVTG